MGVPYQRAKTIASGISAIKRIRYSSQFINPTSSRLLQLGMGICSKSLSQKLQNRAARVITFSNYDRSTDELLRMVNLVKLDNQRLVDKSIRMEIRL